MANTRAGSLSDADRQKDDSQNEGAGGSSSDSRFHGLVQAVATEKPIGGAKQGNHWTSLSLGAYAQNGCSTLSTGRLAMSAFESRAAMSILALPGASPAGCPLLLAQTDPATTTPAI